jgi:hypothetical protein
MSLSTTKHAAVVGEMINRDPGIAPRLARFSQRRALSAHEAQNLASQKEVLGLALDMAGLPKSEILAWSPADENLIQTGLIRGDLSIKTASTSRPARTVRHRHAAGGGVE